ncbi:hypothetical protein [Weissella ceti]|uniref:Transcriptional regulator n=1 Tax=Weissella ceti TaxID=759620 RepID=A0A088GFW9_9LACO|nr:hypothetical protein [Weissella ceti]AIM63008.1 transcriptional regulator [Weissella ceti]
MADEQSSRMARLDASRNAEKNNKPKKPKKRWVKWVIIILLSLLTVGVGLGAYAYMQAKKQLIIHINQRTSKKHVIQIRF